MSNNAFSFNITDDGGVSIDIKNAEGFISNKVVSLDDFANAFSMSNESLDLPLFPKGFRKYKTRGERTLVAFEVPATIINEVYWRNSEGETETYNNIPIPNSVWLVSLNILPNKKYSINKVNVVATNFLGLVSEDSPMYYWPFPNHTISYGVCWGNDPNYSNLKDGCFLNELHSLVNIYFSAAFNSDLGYRFLDPDSEFSSGNIFQCMEGKTNFADKYLVRHSENFNQFIDNLI